MTAATYRPIRCPHGADMLPGDPALALFAIYEDDCRATSGSPVRFWCGPTAMYDPDGVSITEGEYLLDWEQAIQVNEAEDLRRWYKERKAAEDKQNFLRDWDEAIREDFDRGLAAAEAMRQAHTEALILNEGYDLHDEDAASEYRGVWGTHPGYDVTWGQDPIVTREHADHLGEVPWTDRVDD